MNICANSILTDQGLNGLDQLEIYSMAVSDVTDELAERLVNREYFKLGDRTIDFGEVIDMALSQNAIHEAIIALYIADSDDLRQAQSQLIEAITSAASVLAEYCAEDYLKQMMLEQKY